jgi:pantothenate kinase, type III
MKNLLIDIGNSSLKASFAEGTKLEDFHRKEGKEGSLEFIFQLLNDKPVSIIVVSCVGDVEKSFFEELEKKCNKLIVVSGKTRLPIANEYKKPETLGPDRLAAAYAATMLFPGENCMIFDFGTAVTIDFVTAEGKFSGGNISPGLKSRFRALSDYTQRLPVVEADANIPSKGRETKEGIRAGVILGLIFEIEGYIRAYPDYTTIFTGGDANFFAGKIKNPIFAICNLVLIGLAHIANNYVEGN